MGKIQKFGTECEDFFFFFTNLSCSYSKLGFTSLVFMQIESEVTVINVHNWLNDADLHLFCSWHRGSGENA